MRRYPFLSVAAMAWVACGVPCVARATNRLSVSEFVTLAARCAPEVPVATLEAVAKTESGLDPLALHDNTTGVNDKADNLQAALAEGEAWIDRGNSVDVGLMQINSANFGALGLTTRSALAPCASMAGGATILQAAYAGGETTADQQAALLMALSRYHTGSPLKGILDGYARTVMAHAYTGELPAPTAQNKAANAPVPAYPNLPPSWNISETGIYVEEHGAPWIVSLPSPSGPPKQPEGQPVPTATNDLVVASLMAKSLTRVTTRSP